MIRHGKTSTGRSRWRCKPCQITTLNEIDSTAKHLDEFVAWLLGRRRQVDLPGGGRSFRRRCEPLWQLWPFSPIVDEVHEVIFVDGIHLGRNAVVLIAQTPDCVLGWYAARSENSRAWGALMNRIAPPALVLTDAALENAWYHASQIHQATGIIPGWGDAICFNELHHTTPYHNTWDSPQQHEMSYNPTLSRSFEDRGGRSPLIIKDLDLYPQPPTNTRSPTLNSEEPV